jgi:hypothetical protein
MGLLTSMRTDAYPDSKQQLTPGVFFDLKTAGSLAWAAQLAYEIPNAKKVEAVLNQWNWTSVQIFSGRFSSHLPAASTKGFACTAEGALVVAIAGTEPTNIFNWIDDFNIHKTAAGVTDGFLDAFESVAVRITELVSGGGGVFFAGHSLGAAIAAIAAKTLVQQGKLSPDRLRGIYTIGMPRIGNAAYAQAYESSDANVLRDRTFRLVYGSDVVTRVPPSIPPFDFRHVGKEFTCRHGGLFSSAENTNGVGRLVRGNLESLFDPDEVATPQQPDFPAAYPPVIPLLSALPSAIRDHLPDRYLAALGTPPHRSGV